MVDRKDLITASQSLWYSGGGEGEGDGVGVFLLGGGGGGTTCLACCAGVTDCGTEGVGGGGAYE